MKKRLFILKLSTLVFVMLAYSCADKSQKTDADKKLGTIDVEIPESLKDKPEVVTYINDLNKIADDYAILIDQILTDLRGFEKKDVDNLSMMDKIRLMKVSSEVSFKSIDIMSKWSENHNKLDVYKVNLSDDEALALEGVLKRFETRMKQIEKKHANFFKDE